jgi:hypothetical protein
MYSSCGSIRFKLEQVARPGVTEPQKSGVKRLPPERFHCGAKRVRQGTRLRQKAGSIDEVSHKRMAEVSQVDADLVCPASFQAAGEEGGMITEALLHGVACDRVAAARTGDGLLHTAFRITGKGGVDCADVGSRHAPYKGVVFAK